MKKHIDLNTFLIFLFLTGSNIMVALGVLEKNWYGVIGWVFTSVLGFVIYMITSYSKKEDTDWSSIEKRFMEKYSNEGDDYLGI